MFILDWKNIGKTVQDREIRSGAIGSGYKIVLLLSCMHGDEKQGKAILLKLISHYEENPGELDDKKIIFVPTVNPDGYVKNTRCNYNGVDLNRNFPTENWELSREKNDFYSGPSAASEPETMAIVELMEKISPRLIITFHQPYKLINYDGPAKEYAQRLSDYNKYKVTGDIGYPTPGSFGTYAGTERQIPTITLELPENEPDEKVWKDNSFALTNLINSI